MFLLGVLGIINGSFFSGGEIMSCFFKSFNLINSSNDSLIVLPLNSVLKFFGKLAFNTGAMVSFAPPVMLPLLAQLAKTISNTAIQYFKKDLPITN